MRLRPSYDLVTNSVVTSAVFSEVRARPRCPSSPLVRAPVWVAAQLRVHLAMVWWVVREAGARAGARPPVSCVAWVLVLFVAACVGGLMCALSCAVVRRRVRFPGAPWLGQQVVAWLGV